MTKRSHEGSKRQTINGALAILALLALGVGCARLQPGADPIEVRAEQSVSVAGDTIDLFVGLDCDNQELLRAKAPGVHKFAEWLRERVPTPGETGPVRTTTPRGLALPAEANLARLTYKKNRTAENRAKLTAALAALDEALRQTQSNLVKAQAATTQL